VSGYLKNRAEHLTELMDDPDCDKIELFNTYRQFSHVNDLISRWQTLFDAYIAPLAGRQQELRILDIGCGGGDICLKFSDWARKRNLNIQITGIDPEPRAIEYATKLSHVPANVEFRLASSSKLVKEGEKYDVVVSNHLLHHLKNGELVQICKEAETLALKLILFNDIRRSDFGFAAFGLLAPVIYRSSFIYKDGLTSIRRSFNYQELKRLAPSGWETKKLFPFRLMLVHEKKL